MAVVSWRDSPIQAEGSVICTCLLFIVTITVVYYTAYELKVVYSGTGIMKWLLCTVLIYCFLHVCLAEITVENR